MIILAIFFSIASCSKKNIAGHIIQPHETFDLNVKLESLTNQIIDNLLNKKFSRIAVIAFSNIDGRTSTFGSYLSEELTTRIFLTNKFYVIERQLLNKLVDEQTLNATGAIDEETAKSFGEILGVDALVTGTISDLGDSLKVHARLITTETGVVSAVASINIDKTAEIQQMYLTIQKKEEADRTDTRPETTKVKIDVLGWDKTRWGMDSEDLNFLYKDTLQTRANFEPKNGLYGKYFLEKRLQGYDFKVGFTMKEETHKLTGVVVQSTYLTKDFSKCAYLETAFLNQKMDMINKYGNPKFIENRHNEADNKLIELFWYFPSTRIELQWHYMELTEFIPELEIIRASDILCGIDIIYKEIEN